MGLDPGTKAPYRSEKCDLVCQTFHLFHAFSAFVLVVTPPCQEVSRADLQLE